MSSPGGRAHVVRWDAVLTRELAAEKDRALARWRSRALLFDGRRREVFVYFREGTLSWSLRHDAAFPTLLEAVEPPSTALPFPMRLRGVRAPVDERVMVMEFMPLRSGPRPADLVIELLAGQLNCLAVEAGSGTIRHALRTPSRPRHLARGRPYLPPAPFRREGATGLSLDRFEEILQENGRSLASRLAWCSTVNRKALRHVYAGEGAEAAHALWMRLAGIATEPGVAAETSVPTESGKGTDEGAVILGKSQPYPFALPGSPSREVSSLLGAFGELAGSAPPGLGTLESHVLRSGLDGASSAGRGSAPAETPDLGLLLRLDEARERLERRITSLEREKAALEDPGAARALGHLILARYSEIRPGTAEAEIVDLSGEPVTVRLVPGGSVQESAERYFRKAAKAEKAAKRLPELEGDQRRRLERLARLTAALKAGAVSEGEVIAALPADLRGSHQSKSKDSRTSAGASLPYRVYRTTGGSEIRVGLGAKRNDDLTFRHSSPNDIWLHARHSAGAHVILRRASASQMPSEEEVREAAVVAAVQSKARGAGVVPVDWTLRKYVRKPRKSPPGAVVPERTRTIFVEPDHGLVVRMREEQP